MPQSSTCHLLHTNLCLMTTHRFHDYLQHRVADTRNGVRGEAEHPESTHSCFLNSNVAWVCLHTRHDSFHTTQLPDDLRALAQATNVPQSSTTVDLQRSGGRVGDHGINDRADSMHDLVLAPWTCQIRQGTTTLRLDRCQLQVLRHRGDHATDAASVPYLNLVFPREGQVCESGARVLLDDHGHRVRTHRRNYRRNGDVALCRTLGREDSECHASVLVEILFKRVVCQSTHHSFDTSVRVLARQCCATQHLAPDGLKSE
mmetsp:Transcript_43764/g.115599  ORF Transcript_43764/g.115599 Transcript_43764/m.115599 type:complete len:259 (+) Transcript_43764:888-1664(+)